MMSPLHAANPATSASPLPVPCWVTILISGRIARATATVSSVECPSTSTTSSTHLGSVANTCGRLGASFKAGITTLTLGVMARAADTGRYGNHLPRGTSFPASLEVFDELIAC